jgi:Xaa-Pro aminopeptidase
LPEHAHRLAAFRDNLASGGVSGAFLPESADVEYLTGVPRVRQEFDPYWDPELDAQGCFVGVARDPVFVIPHLSQWECEAGSRLDGWDTLKVAIESDPVFSLREGARAVGIRGAMAVGAETPFRQLQALASALPDVRLVPASDFVSPLRLVKDEDEIAHLSGANRIAQEALESVLARFGTSFHRLDLLAEIERELMLAGSDTLVLRPDVHAVGPSTSIEWLFDSSCGDRADVVEAPAAVSVDLGAVHAGYRSDIGRTAFVGAPPAGQERALAVVQAAHHAALDALRPGAIPEAIDGIVRTSIAEAGLADAFWLSMSGHGLGLELHERPRLRAGVTEPLPENAVVTIEVGLWKRGETSAFWEDDYVVRADGPERLARGDGSAYVIG